MLMRRSCGRDRNGSTFRLSLTSIAILYFANGLLETVHGQDSSSWGFYDSLLTNPELEATLSVNDTSSGTGPKYSSNVVQFSDPSINRTYNLCNLATFLPYSNDDGLRGDMHEDAAAVLMAIHHFNNNRTRNSILSEITGDDTDVYSSCNVYLTAEFYDTKFSPIESTRVLTDLLDRNHTSSTPLPTAIVGAYRSATTSPLAILSGVNNIPQISYASSSTDFDNKEQYPLFGRLTTSSGDGARAVVDYLVRLNVTHVGVIFVTDTYGSAYQKAIQDVAADVEPRPLKTDSVSISFKASDAEIENAISHLKNIQYRYFFAIIFDRHYERVMKEAVRQGIVGEGFMWFFSDGIDRSHFERNFRFDKDSPLAAASHGIGFITNEAGHTCAALNRNCNEAKAQTGHDKFHSVWSETIQDESATNYFQSKNPEFIKFDSNHAYQTTPSQYSYFLYDSVMSLGLSACRAEQEDKEFFSSQALYYRFNETRFKGASGSVEIDPKTGTRFYYSNVFTVWNVIANEPDKDGNVDYSFVPTFIYTRTDSKSNINRDVIVTTEEEDSSPSAEWVEIPGNLFNYSDKTNTPPPILDPVDMNQNLIGKNGQIAGMVLMALVIFPAILFIGWTFLLRDNKVVRASQPLFLVLVALGAIIMAGTIVPLSFEQDRPQQQLDLACMLAPWLYITGFVFSFSALFTKTHLIHKIYLYPDIETVTFRPRDVLITFLILLIPNVIILTCWTFFSPLTYQRINKDSKDSFERPVESYGVCTCDKPIPFVVTILAFNLGSLLVANFKAYQCRNIQTEYHESRYIAIAMASTLQALCMGVPILIVVAASPHAKFFVKAGIIFVTCTALIFLTFVPKIISVKSEAIREGEEQQRIRMKRGRYGSDQGSDVDFDEKNFASFNYDAKKEGDDACKTVTTEQESHGVKLEYRSGEEPLEDEDDESLGSEGKRNDEFDEEAPKVTKGDHLYNENKEGMESPKEEWDNTKEKWENTKEKWENTKEESEENDAGEHQRPAFDDHQKKEDHEDDNANDNGTDGHLTNEVAGRMTNTMMQIDSMLESLRSISGAESMQSMEEPEENLPSMTNSNEVVDIKSQNMQQQQQHQTSFEKPNEHSSAKDMMSSPNGLNTTDQKTDELLDRIFAEVDE